MDLQSDEDLEADHLLTQQSVGLIQLEVHTGLNNKCLHVQD